MALPITIIATAGKDNGNASVEILKGEIEQSKEGRFARSGDFAWVVPDNAVLEIKIGRMKGRYLIASKGDAYAWGPSDKPILDAAYFDGILRTQIGRQLWDVSDKPRDWKEDMMALIAAGVAALACALVVVAWLDIKGMLKPAAAIIGA